MLPSNLSSCAQTLLSRLALKVLSDLVEHAGLARAEVFATQYVREAVPFPLEARGFLFSAVKVLGSPGGPQSPPQTLMDRAPKQ